VFASQNEIVLSDGVGGSAGGLAAALLAVGAAIGRVAVWESAGPEEVFQAAHAAVRDHQRRVVSQPHAACTLTIVVLSEPERRLRVTIGHVGDSSVYLVRDEEMSLLTPPHTLAHQLEREGRITRAESHWS
jgi:serine/threonine protein phosphatase PrpC